MRFRNLAVLGRFLRLRGETSALPRVVRQDEACFAQYSARRRNKCAAAQALRLKSTSGRRAAICNKPSQRYQGLRLSSPLWPVKLAKRHGPPCTGLEQTLSQVPQAKVED